MTEMEAWLAFFVFVGFLIALSAVLFVGAAAIVGAAILFGFAALQGFVGLAAYVACWVIFFPVMLLICIVIGAAALWATWREERLTA